MSMGKSNVKPTKIDVYNDYAEEAYDDAKECDDKGSYAIYESERIYEEDYHYTIVNFLEEGRANFYLEWDDDSDLDLYIFDEDGLLIAKDSYNHDKTNSDGNSYVLLAGIDVNDKPDYLVCVRCDSVEGSHADYTLKAKLYDDKDDYEDMLEDIGLDGDDDYELPTNYKFREFGDRTLSINDDGDRGTDVVHLQRILYKFGYFDDDFDGIFGKITKEAVEDFQKDANILVDGIVGPQTYGALYATLKWKKSTSSSREKYIASGLANASGFARAFNDELSIGTTSLLYSDEGLELPPIWVTENIKVTYRCGTKIYPDNSMMLVSFNSSSGYGISLMETIDVNIPDDRLRETLTPLTTLFKIFNVEEDSKIYVSETLGSFTSSGDGRIAIGGGVFAIGIKKAFDIEIAGESYTTNFYEEIRFEVSPSNNSNENEYSYSQLESEIDHANTSTLAQIASFGIILGVIFEKMTESAASAATGFFLTTEDILEDALNNVYPDYRY